MSGKFIIAQKLPSLNEYTLACRSSAQKGNRFKQQIEEVIMWAIRYYENKGFISEQGEKPCVIEINWHEKTKRRDADNIQSAQKFILDALQKCQILKNDSRKYVQQIFHEIIDDNADFVVVELRDV